MLRKSISLLLALIMVFSILTVIPFPVFAEKSGIAGQCKWTLDDDGVLTISGNGDMNDYYWHLNSFSNTSPWYNNSKIKEVIIEDGITGIGDYAFYDCENLTNVTISDSVERIGESAFSGTAWDDNLPDGLIYAGKVFYKYKGEDENCPESIIIADGTLGIAAYAFNSCTNLINVSIPNSVTNIGDYAFEYCTGITNITIPNSVTSIGDYAFESCYSLKRITIPNSVTSIGVRVFRFCSSLKSVVLSNSLTCIEMGMFQKCENLTYVTIPDSVTNIGERAFHHCEELKRVTLGDSISRIGYQAFMHCDKLTDIYYAGSETDWNGIDISTDGNDPLFSAKLHCNYKGTNHSINSDYENNHFFYFINNEEIEDLLYSMPSVQYNPRLSHFLACMARSAYTEELAKSNYKELGFDEPEVRHCDSGDPIAGFYVGEKELDGGKKLVMVTIRGSDDWSEWLQTNFNLGNSAMIMSAGLHSGFLASAQKVYELLSERYGGTPSGDLIFVVTGHSLGAAVGNILARWLYLSDVPTECLYAYNFACPNVGMASDDVSVWNENGIHNNIINIGNWCDQVSHEPGFGVESLSISNRLLWWLNGWKKWKRFGVSYWFDNGLYNKADAHDMDVYLDYLEKELDETHFSEKEYEVKAISVHCPVDAVVYDSNGNPIAGTINNEPNYYGYEPGEKALIFIDGDRKLFHVFNNEAFEVKLIGTDEGEMEYGICTGDMTSGDVYSEKWFEGVALETGKEMIGKTVNVIDSDNNMVHEDKLINVGDEPMEIMTDGEEVPYTYSYILGDADDSGEVEAVDATWLQRYIASFATPYDFDTLMHGDVDYDGEADITDVTMIQRYLAQFSTPYLVGADVV